MSSSTNGIFSNKLLYSIGIGLGVATLSGVTYWYYKYKQHQQDIMPDKWRRVGTLQHINLFPIKSCAPLCLFPDDTVECTVLGLQLDGFRDRALMIVDAENRMITARVYPRMVLIETKKLGPNLLQIAAPHQQPIELDFEELRNNTSNKKIKTAVWGVSLSAVLCPEKFSKWLSQFIIGEDSGLNMVYFPHLGPVRAINPDMRREPYIREDDTGTFADATSYMLMNLASINDVSKRVKRPVHPLRFRGNFYLEMDTDEPYAEDKWNWIKIGHDAVFRVVSPCVRCSFPNINPSTGVRDLDGEPTKTLKSYRKWSKYPNPVIGIHLGVRIEGTIKASDIVYVEDK